MKPIDYRTPIGLIAILALSCAMTAQANDNRPKRPTKSVLSQNEVVDFKKPSPAPSQNEAARPDSGAADSADASRKNKPLTTSDCIKCGPDGTVLTKEGEKFNREVDKAIDKVLGNLPSKGVVANPDGTGDMSKPSL